jgi:hypothetical protein
VVLYGWETWSLTLREQHRLRVFENSALKRIFGSKRDKVTGGSQLVLFAKRNNDEDEDELGRACSTNEDKKNANRILVRKPANRILVRKP